MARGKLLRQLIKLGTQCDALGFRSAHGLWTLAVELKIKRLDLLALSHQGDMNAY